MISTSRLRSLVSIQKNTPTVTGQGERVDGWAEIAKDYAEIVPLEGREFYEAQQTQAEITTKITIRYRPLGITALNHRILFGGRTFQIVAPPMNTDMAYRELVMMCKEIEVGAG